MTRINSDISTMAARRSYAMNRLAVQRSLFNLATGLRINRAADDPAGLIASDTLRSELAALEAETRTATRQFLRAATAEGALEEVSNLLREAQVLALENANTGGTTPEERQANQQQIDSILTSIDRLGGTTAFNGQKLLDGSARLSLGSASLTVDQIASGALGESEIDGDTFHLSDIKSGGTLDTMAGHGADANTVIKAAVSEVAMLRGKIGTFQKDTVEPRLNGLRVAIENVSAANSMILDTDFAAETSRLVRVKLLERASRGAMALSRFSNRNVLALLGDGLRVI